MHAKHAGPGILISFDGLDSSGKATQANKLAERLTKLGREVRQLRTPDYSTPSGQELKLRLQHKLGNWQETSWQDKLGYFAANRAEHREEVIQTLADGQVVIYDRYVPSSLAFITVEAGVDASGREEVYQAVIAQEYKANKMPQENASVFLDVPPCASAELLQNRKKHRHDADEYTDHLHVQERMYNEYRYLCESNPDHYLRIKCLENDRLLGIEDVADLVWKALTNKFPNLQN